MYVYMSVAVHFINLLVSNLYHIHSALGLPVSTQTFYWGLQSTRHQVNSFPSITMTISASYQIFMPFGYNCLDFWSWLLTAVWFKLVAYGHQLIPVYFIMCMHICMYVELTYTVRRESFCELLWRNLRLFSLTSLVCLDPRYLWYDCDDYYSELFSMLEGYIDK